MADVVNVANADENVRTTVVLLLVGLVAVLWPAERHPAWLTLQLRTAVTALWSLLYSVGTLLAGPQALSTPGEIAILLSLLFIAVRHCRPLWAVVCGTLNGVALLLTPVRYSHSLKDGGTLGFMVGGLVLIGLVAGLAAYLCSVDYRCTVAVSETRREERLAIAADLHDFVAHHVTGILVPPGHDRRRNRVRRRRNEARLYLCRMVVLRLTWPLTMPELYGRARLAESYAAPSRTA
ncbi:hypothetical protein [Streptomyces sp. NBC_01235]|uniref:hypothetical protein n=1 Tax=Streptomyces sp. NBC_01235 TaxID=2903788 RepID=UPI002E167973|nr:hypothetical protein OG289_03240 [Streptomyces sp. NBC_01235]